MNTSVEGIILAAGFSSRTGVFKMGLKFGNKTLIQHTIEAMKPLCSQVIVVGGFKIRQTREFTRDYPDVKVVFNPRYQQGMFTSIKEGIKHIKADWFFLTPGDYPLITTTIYQQLLEARAGSPGDIFIPVFQGRKGHPILLNRRLISEIDAEPEDSNLRAFIRRKGFVPVPVNDEAILVDIDTMADYEKARTRY